MKRFFIRNFILFCAFAIAWQSLQASPFASREAYKLYEIAHTFLFENKECKEKLCRRQPCDLSDSERQEQENKEKNELKDEIENHRALKADWSFFCFYVTNDETINVRLTIKLSLNQTIFPPPYLLFHQLLL